MNWKKKAAASKKSQKTETKKALIFYKRPRLPIEKPSFFPLCLSLSPISHISIQFPQNPLFNLIVVSSISDLGFHSYMYMNWNSISMYIEPIWAYKSRCGGFEFSTHFPLFFSTGFTFSHELIVSSFIDLGYPRLNFNFNQNPNPNFRYSTPKKTKKNPRFLRRN